jgi:hypothetical protein
MSENTSTNVPSTHICRNTALPGIRSVVSDTAKELGVEMQPSAADRATRHILRGTLRAVVVLMAEAGFPPAVVVGEVMNAIQNFMKHNVPEDPVEAAMVSKPAGDA